MTVGKLARVIPSGVQSPTVFISLVNGVLVNIANSSTTSSSNDEEEQESSLMSTTTNTTKQKFKIGDICIHSVTQVVKFASWMMLQMDEIKKINQEKNSSKSTETVTASPPQPLSLIINKFIIDDINTSKLATFSQLTMQRHAHQTGVTTFSISVDDILGFIQQSSSESSSSSSASSLKIQGRLDDQERMILIHQNNNNNTTAIIKPGLCVSASLIDRVFAIKDRFSDVIEEFKATRKKIVAADESTTEEKTSSTSSSSSPSMMMEIAWKDIHVNVLDMGGVLASLNLESGNVNIVPATTSSSTTSTTTTTVSIDRFNIKTFEGREQQNNLRIISSLQCSHRYSTSK